MKKINLITEIIKLSSSYKCGNITFEALGENVYISAVNGDGDSNFYSTSLCIELSSFDTYFTIIGGKINLVVF